MALPVPRTDLKTSLPRKLNVATSDKLIGLVERGGLLPDLASRQAIDQAIAKGRGGIFFNLTEQTAAPAVELWNQNEPRI